MAEGKGSFSLNIGSYSVLSLFPSPISVFVSVPCAIMYGR